VFEVVGARRISHRPAKSCTARAKALLDEAGRWKGPLGASPRLEPELRLAVEIIFPTWLLLQCFARSPRSGPADAHRTLRGVLSGTEEALLQAQVDLASVRRCRRASPAILSCGCASSPQRIPAIRCISWVRELTLQDLAPSIAIS